MALCPITWPVWSGSATPTSAGYPDSHAVELGLKFRADVNGTVTGVRFYKSLTNTGTHVGNLRSSTGQLLASVTFANEPASGWQQANSSTPAAISANMTYVISYQHGRWALKFAFLTEK